MKKHKAFRLFGSSAACSVGLVGTVSAGTPGNYYLKPHVGVGIVEDNDLTHSGIATPGADGDGEFGTGRNAAPRAV